MPRSSCCRVSGACCWRRRAMRRVRGCNSRFPLRVHSTTLRRMNPMRSTLLLSLLTTFTHAAEPVDNTPKLEVLNGQIKANPEDSQAYSNRGYTYALLGRKDEARADLKNALALKDNAPMHNRVGWAYFNIGDYAE